MKKYLISIISVAIFVLILILGTKLSKPESTCTQKDAEYAFTSGNYYTPEEAYKFGLKIKKIVQEKDTHKLYELIDGELSYGPRRDFALKKPFDEIFPPEWQSSVLKSQPPCSPMGWRGFELADSKIWFNKSNDKWLIDRINGAYQESAALNDPAWKVGEKIIPPHCFTTNWISSDNFESFEEFYGIDSHEFQNNPGLFYGKTINSTKPIEASWGDDQLVLASNLEHCFKGKIEDGRFSPSKDGTIEIKESSAYSKICLAKDSCTEYEYKVISHYNLESCKKLAPTSPWLLLECSLIEVGNYTGGTYDWFYNYGIYGLASDTENREFILPLKFFKNKNESINFIKK